MNPAEQVDEVRIPLPSYNLANATRAIAAEALKRSGSVDAAAKLMKISANKLKRIMDTNGIREPRVSSKKTRRKAKGRTQKG